MSGFIPDITTTVRVKVNAHQLEDGISALSTHGWFDEIINDMKAKRAEVESLKDPVAEAVSNNLSEYQRQIISMKHYKTGMMANSVDVEQDGDGVYLVGNTATSVDGFPYPLAIEQGSSAHWVAPVTFKALHWVQGNDFFSRGHMVSGISSDPFVDPSIEMSKGDVEDLITEFMDNVFGD